MNSKELKDAEWRLGRLKSLKTMLPASEPQVKALKGLLVQDHEEMGVDLIFSEGWRVEDRRKYVNLMYDIVKEMAK